MPPREGIYGLLAEFETPGELVRGRTAGAAGWLAPAGLLLALSAGRGGGGYRLSSQQGAAVDADWRIDGVGSHVRTGDMGFYLGLSVEYCRASDLLVASVYYPGV